MSIGLDPSTLARLRRASARDDKKGAFRARVLAVVAKIPQGATMTYKEVAARAGNPRAYRAVGNMLNKNYNPAIPCHRVVRSDGKTGGYNRGAEEKQRRLCAERAI